MILVRYYTSRLAPDALEFHERSHCKGCTEREFECHIVSNCGLEIDACDIFLETIVGNHVYTIARGNLVDVSFLGEENGVSEVLGRRQRAARGLLLAFWKRCLRQGLRRVLCMRS